MSRHFMHLFKKHKLLLVGGLGLLTAIVLAACGGSMTKPIPPRFQPNFASIQAELFTKTKKRGMS